MEQYNCAYFYNSYDLCANYSVKENMFCLVHQRLTKREYEFCMNTMEQYDDNVFRYENLTLRKPSYTERKKRGIVRVKNPERKKGVYYFNFKEGRILTKSQRRDFFNEMKFKVKKKLEKREIVLQRVRETMDRRVKINKHANKMKNLLKKIDDFYKNI